MTESNIPNLSGVIAPSDVSQKGTGSYKADYINWARVAHLIQEKAPGWQFHVRLAPDGGYVWRAPNGSGFMVGYFTSPQGEVTADFPQAVMDNRNQPVPFDRISARDITDTHRRALAAAACFTFGLAWELWAKETVEDPHQRDLPPGEKLISEPQRKRLFALTKEVGISVEQAKEIIAQHGFESTTHITQDKYDAVCAAIQSVNTGEAK